MKISKVISILSSIEKKEGDIDIPEIENFKVSEYSKPVEGEDGEFETVLGVFLSK